jgi:carbon-monoxide dehydrogenase large subunit
MIGQRVRRREDPRLLTGRGEYVDDINLDGALHAVFVRSWLAHARVRSIDASEAQAIPGVQVFTAADVDALPLATWFEVLPKDMPRPCLAADRVRFAGEILAVVLTPTREQSIDAAELVFADLEELPPVIDPVEALAGGTLLFENRGTNVVVSDGPEAPSAALFDDCDVVTGGSTKSQRIHGAPIEPRSAAARVDDGRLTVWLSTQAPHHDRNRLTECLRLEPADVRVVAPDVGGGFGTKGLGVEEVMIAWLARHTGQPIRWTETRSEHMTTMGHGRALMADFRIGGDRDGHIKALWVRFLQDTGAYPETGAFLPIITRSMLSGVYAIPKIEVRYDAVVTSTTQVGAVRGAGRPEATQIVERAVETLAAELGLDSVELRRRNLIAPDQLPYKTATGAVYDAADYGRALETAIEAAGYDDLRAEQQRRRDTGDTMLLGIGVAAYIEVSDPITDKEYGAVDITPEGDAVLKTGSFSHGQGHATTFSQIVAAELGIPVDRVTVIKGDTDKVPRGTGTSGSKSTQLGGSVARIASQAVVAKAKEIAAELLEADSHDVVLDLTTGAFHVAGSLTPSLSWTELAAELVKADRLEELSIERDFQASHPTYPTGAHVVVVEVDGETGSVQLRRVIAVDDCGTIINPVIVEGQVHGGLAAGIAQALFEELEYNEDGTLLNANFATYGIPSASEFPWFETVPIETPTPLNPLGAKGIGESGTVGVTSAVLNAVIDALAPFGVRSIDMPANAERVWRAIQAATSSTNETQTKEMVG